jgi:hypothetical protein
VIEPQHKDTDSADQDPRAHITTASPIRANQSDPSLGAVFPGVAGSRRPHAAEKAVEIASVVLNGLGHVADQNVTECFQQALIFGPWKYDGDELVAFRTFTIRS